MRVLVSVRFKNSFKDAKDPMVISVNKADHGSHRSVPRPQGRERTVGAAKRNSIERREARQAAAVRFFSVLDVSEITHCSPPPSVLPRQYD